MRISHKDTKTQSEENPGIAAKRHKKRKTKDQEKISRKDAKSQRLTANGREKTQRKYESTYAKPTARQAAD